MLEKIGELAEQTATRASRRQFLGRFGRGAMTAAAVVGGLLALPREAQAAKRCGGRVCPAGYDYCCSYLDHAGGKRVHFCSPAPCPR